MTLRRPGIERGAAEPPSEALIRELGSVERRIVSVIGRRGAAEA